ncbi:MAG: acyl-CoA desaturase [Moraxellaceae bacterium]|jgi:stearoyl-CoA desaturase (delta-9 desaturase)|nr:acyl-CoA desaturase [Moraxellaceae bacterium]
MTSSATARPPVNWASAIVLTTTPIAAALLVPWYAFHFDFSIAAWVSFFVFLHLGGTSISAGYHRLWAHRAYEAHWSLRLLFMIFGTMTMQNSILIWASSHRTHHRHVDEVDGDPYAITRGFWFAHFGWMLRNYDTGKPDFSNANDLMNDRIVMFQHRHYLPLLLLTNIGFPLAVGWLAGDLWGVLLLGGLLRLVVSHHVTFLINSLCHVWGSRPYTDENSARDNTVLAVLTWGEGYHNYHHIFQYDYRNGVKWWQYDTSKWLIYSLSLVGLTWNLKRCSGFAIQKAQLTMQFKRTEQQIARQAATRTEVEALKARMTHEYEIFTASLQDWARVKEEWYTEKKVELLQKWREAAFHDRFREIEFRLKMQRRRLRALARYAATP